MKFEFPVFILGISEQEELGQWVQYPPTTGKQVVWDWEIWFPDEEEWWVRKIIRF